MAIDYAKWIDSTTTHWIANSGSDERKKYHGGQAGDQTGHEAELRKWYSRPWTVILRWPDPAVGIKIARIAIGMCLNNQVGYDQYQRTTYWKELEKVGYDPNKITVPVEQDCTAGVTANCKAVGYLTGINSLKNLAIDIYSGNMRARFVAAGFKALTDKKYLDSPNYLLPGDILLYEGHHAATNITYGKYVRNQPTSDTYIRYGDSGTDVRNMQRRLLAWNPNCLPKYGADGDFGSETLNALNEFQQAKGLPVTGVYNAVTKAALEGNGVAYVEATGNVNVRSAPGTENRILGVATKGMKLVYQGESREVDGRAWYKVIFNGENGWISSKWGRIV